MSEFAVNKIKNKKWTILNEKSIKDEYMDYAMKNNKLKFINITTKDPYVRDVCLETTKKEDGFEI